MTLHDRYSRNRKSKREPNDRILLVCGGETEDLYFKRFKIDLGRITIKHITDNRNPLNIVKTALKERDKSYYIMVWCIFDKDDFADFDDAIALATKEGLRVAFSNQAFELWFLMHYEVWNGACHRNDYKMRLEKHIGHYEKTDSGIYDRLKSKMHIAIENARFGHQTHRSNKQKPSDWESCTTVYELVRELNRWRKN